MDVFGSVSANVGQGVTPDLFASIGLSGVEDSPILAVDDICSASVDKKAESTRDW